MAAPSHLETRNHPKSGKPMKVASHTASIREPEAPSGSSPSCYEISSLEVVNGLSIPHTPSQIFWKKGRARTFLQYLPGFARFRRSGVDLRGIPRSGRSPNPATLRPSHDVLMLVLVLMAPPALSLRHGLEWCEVHVNRVGLRISKLGVRVKS